MTFPTASETGGSNAASTSHDLTLPSFSAGDLIIVNAFAVNTPDFTWTFDGATDKWTQLWQVDYPGYARGNCKYRVMQGGDGSTLTIGLSLSRKFAYSIVKVTGWHGTQAPECGTGYNEYSNVQNPPSVTASWGSADNLFLAFDANDSRPITSGLPTNYTGFDAHGAVNDVACARTAYRQYASASDDPSAFTATGNSTFVVNTVVVRPAAPSTARSHGYITT